MRHASLLLMIGLTMFIACKSFESHSAEKFGFGYDDVRSRKCLPVIEGKMKSEKRNDSVILYAFGQLDTTRGPYHFSKRILFRDDHILEEEDEFFLPTASSHTSYFLTVRHNYISDSTYAFIQQYFWNDAFRTKSQAINYLEARQLLREKGISFCK